MKIFLSYCGDDRAQKNLLKDRIVSLVGEYREMGIAVEIVEMETHCAGNWDEWMIPAVKECDIFVPLISDNAMYPKTGVPKRMLEELTTARNTNKKMVPVIMSSNGVSDTFQAHIGRVSQVWYAYDTDGDGDPFDEAVGKIRILINAIIKNDTVDQGESVDVIGCGVVQNTRFVGREEYLNQLERELESTNVVILKGDGGIGKTSLAENFFFKSDKYKRAYLVSASEGIKSGICNIRFRSTEYVTNEDERYSANYSLLKALNKDTIVILDNCDKELDEYELYQLVGRMDCKFIITSRIGKSDYSHEIKINPMDKKELLTLVYKHFPDIAEENDLDEEEVKTELYKFFDSVGCHTLTVEMASIIMRDGEIEIKEVHEAIMKCNERFKTKHSGAKIASPFEHLSTLYNYADLSPAQRKVLSFMCLVPSTVGITRKELKTLLELDGMYLINELVDKTFLRRNDKSLTMHPLFSDVFFNAEEIAKDGELCDYLSAKMADWIINDSGVGDAKSSARLVEVISFLIGKRHQLLVATESGRDELPYLHVNLGRGYTDLGRYDDAERVLTDALSFITDDSPYSLDASIYIALSGVYELTGRFEEALEYNESTLEIYEKIEESGQVDDGFVYAKAAALASTGRCYGSLGKYDEAIELVENAISVLENESDPDDEANISKIIECYDSLIVLYADKGDSKTGMEQGRMAFEYAEKLSSEFAKDSAMAVTYNNLAYASQKILETASAITFFEKTLELYDKMYEGYPDHIQYAGIYNNLGMTYLMTGNIEKAIEYLDRASEIYEKSYGSVSPMIAKIKGNIGQAYYQKGNIQEAYEYTEASIQMYEELFGQEGGNADVAISYGNMGLIFYSLGKSDEAVEYLKIGIDRFENYVGAGSTSAELGGMYSLLALAYSGLNDYEKSLESAKASLEIRRKVMKAIGFNLNIALTVASSLFDVCVCLKQLKKNDEAIIYAEEALQITKSLGDEGIVQQTNIYKTLTELYISKGNFEKARECQEQIRSLQEEKSPRSGDVSQILTVINKAAIELNSGDVPLSLSLCDKATELFDRGNGVPKRDDILAAYQIVMAIYSHLEEYQKTISLGLDVIIYALKSGLSKELTAELEFQVAEAFYLVDDLEKALKYVQYAITTFEAIPNFEDSKEILASSYELREAIKGELE